ncbi:iron-sulfur cluster assembly scaffold protein [Spiroplasma endosymbiont of 'Nebria riversi']|uniref:iron-sulfur cluster assembly scaffold protein n=1 Tax=Spiroplasma endosymbiont of 'Nebria riversi' TaxID=2792084 RepID=UPI001C03BC48|nr:iron-sulfur cluster assembly scaffold protein [Spiroplasma endosymbiont of 'Nebria riversi']
MISYNEWRKIIINHYQNPQYQGFIKHNQAIERLQSNLSCADQLNLQLVVINDVIVSARFMGYACAIATSSADLICQTITNKSKYQALAILNNYSLMINVKDYDSDILEDLIVFTHTKKQPNRKQCSLLASSGFLMML